MSYAVEERIRRLERIVDEWKSCMSWHTKKVEKLEEQLSEAQCEIAELRKLVKAKSKSE